MWVYASVMVECDGTNSGGRVVSRQHLCCAGGLQNTPAYSCHCDCLEESHTYVNVHAYEIINCVIFTKPGCSTCILKSPNNFLWGDSVLLRLNTKY